MTIKKKDIEYYQTTLRIEVISCMKTMNNLKNWKGNRHNVIKKTDDHVNHPRRKIIRPITVIRTTGKRAVNVYPIEVKEGTIWPLENSSIGRFVLKKEKRKESKAKQNRRQILF